MNGHQWGPIDTKPMTVQAPEQVHPSAAPSATSPNDTMLAVLQRIEALLRPTGAGRPSIDQTYLVSDTQGFYLDYRERKHLYCFSANAITLNLQDVGTIAISANTWTDISFRQNIKIFTSGTTNPVPILVRATDETISAPGGGGGGGGGGAITAAAGSYASGALVDGAIATIGAKADAAQIDPTQAASVIALLKGMQTELVDIEAQTTTTPTVSGTVTANQGTANATPWNDNVAQVGGTAVDTNSGLKSAGTQRVVLATDQPALTNKLLVTPDSVALPLHQSVNVDQVNGTTTDTNSGLKSAGTQRIVLATDQPALTNKLLVTPDSVALPAHQSTNVDQVNGTTVDTNSGNKSAGTQRVVLATDQPALTNKLLVTPDALPAHQSTNVDQLNGNTTSTNQGTIDAGTQRHAIGGAATGTKTNVASSASSVTILASNTARKGAVIYNDSTQILYLDLSGGTASSTSYSVQMPTQSYFEVPGPAVYNGAITGIWAAANGNARVTEWS